MDRNRVLDIVRGTREVAKARGNRNSSGSNRRGQNINGRSRVRGQVGVAVRRDDNNDGLLPAFGSRYDDEERETDVPASGEDTLGPRTAVTQQQAGAQPPPDTAGFGTVDLTRDSPGTSTTTGDALPGRTAADAESSPDGGDRSAQSLGSWLVPAPPPPKAAAAKGGNRRRKRPLQDAEGSEPPRGTRTWASSSRGQDNGIPGGGRAGGDGSLAAWLVPRQSVASRERRSTPRRRGTSHIVAGHESGGHSDSSGDDDSGRWMSDRLEGLDPNGAARAKDSWTDRERRNLTSTDVALGAKRKGRGGRCGGGGRRGWRTKAGGSGAAVSRLFKGSDGGDGDGRKKKRKR